MVCGVKRIPSLYLPSLTGRPSRLSTSTPPEDPASLSTINGATMRLCKADLPASAHSSRLAVAPTAFLLTEPTGRAEGRPDPRSQQVARAQCGLGAVAAQTHEFLGIHEQSQSANLFQVSPEQLMQACSRWLQGSRADTL
jgi:hypothetical protein